jgi:UDP-glucuronate decarboxylase
MKVIVTGGAGFIGSWLCEYLVGKGESVICLDNFSTGSKRNVEHLVSNPNFRLMEHDVTQPLDIEIDQIYHLASIASPVHYQKFPVETALSNSLGTHNMIKLALKNNAVLLFASTSEVYGDPEEHPQREEYWGRVNPIGIRSCYDESKRFAEALIMSYVRQYGLKAKIIRIFNTYGPRMSSGDGRGIPNFIVQALKNEPLTVYGDGSQTRSFCYVGDLVEGIYGMMHSGETGPINLGNPNEYSILETAKMIKDRTNSSSEMVFRELPEDDPKKRKPDIMKARERLGWEPKTSFEEGLNKTIQYFERLK